MGKTCGDILVLLLVLVISTAQVALTRLRRWLHL